MYVYIYIYRQVYVYIYLHRSFGKLGILLVSVLRIGALQCRVYVAPPDFRTSPT